MISNVTLLVSVGALIVACEDTSTQGAGPELNHNPDVVEVTPVDVIDPNVGEDDSAHPNAGTPAEVNDAEVTDKADLPETDPADIIPEEPQAPEGYGVVAFDRPSEEELTHHAYVGYEVVALYNEPKMEGNKVGFLRMGRRFQVTKATKSADCRKGWHQLSDGAWACASKGLVVESNAPYAKSTPPPPRLDQAFPYDYAFVRKHNAPMWWRIPTNVELKEAERLREGRETQRGIADGTIKPETVAAAKAPVKKVDKPKAKSTDSKDATSASKKPVSILPSVVAADNEDVVAQAKGSKDDAPKKEKLRHRLKDKLKDTFSKDKEKDEPKPKAVAQANTKTTPTGQGSEPAVAQPPEEPEPPMSLPFSRAHPWLERGFFLSLGETERHEGRSYYRTARGGIVDKSYLAGYKPKDFHGFAIDEEVSLPVAFVIRKEAALFELTDGDKLKKVKTVERRTFLDLSEETEIKGKAYMITKDGLLVRKDRLVMPEMVEVPEGLDPWDRWIDVSLEKQMLVAYEGSRPRYVTLVSTGKKGSEEEPFETPTGRWRVYSKQVTSNMDGATATDGNYAIQDVPWVMYFDGSYALHGAFWHRSFGFVRSHGCVNLGPSDARWLFQWTTPFLPEGWHGVHATDENPGTTVVVHD